MPPLRLGKVVAELNPQQLRTQPTNCEMWKTPENSQPKYPQNDGPWKSPNSLKQWQSLVSMLDFWGLL